MPLQNAPGAFRPVTCNRSQPAGMATTIILKMVSRCFRENTRGCFRGGGGGALTLKPADGCASSRVRVTTTLHRALFSGDALICPGALEIADYRRLLGRVHTTRLGPERFRNATGRPCSHLFHCVRSFRNEPTTSRCDRSGTVPERVRLALWCERATGPVPEPFQLPVTFVDSQPILHISKRSSLHGIFPQIV